MFKAIFITCISILLIASSLSAQVPNTVNYQGKLTDASGDPVADGAYFVKFIIYDASVGGTGLWNSGAQPVTTVDGLFTYELGSVITLPLDIFDDSTRYLGITVGVDAELTPRTKLNTVPYAKTIDGSKYVDVSGDVMTGSLRLQNSGNTRVFLENSTSFGILDLYGSTNLYHVTLAASTQGELLLYDTDGDNTARLSSEHSAGGALLLTDPNGTEDIYLNAGGTGNTTIILPDNAIDNTEILDEPGIVGVLSSTAFVVLNQTTTSMVDLATVTITIPSSGYIYLTGHTQQYINGTTGTNRGLYQIDEASGGGVIDASYTQVGFTSPANTGTIYQSVDVNRVYFKSAGTYTFRLEGLASPSNSATASTTCYGSKMLAMYVPTSYGSVTTVADNPMGDDKAKLVTITDEDGNSHTWYEIDLRNLELKAKEAQLKVKEAELEALKIERELSRARNAQNNN